MANYTKTSLQVLRNKKIYKLGATAPLALLLSGCVIDFLAFIDDSAPTVYTYGTEGDDNITSTGWVSDIIRGLGGNDTIDGGGAYDWIYGGAGDDIIDGGNGRDTIYGDDGDDRLNGGAGDDSLTGGKGADVLEGDYGEDSAIYIDSDAAVNINLLSNIHSGGDAQGDSLTSIENVFGSAFNDVIIGDTQNNDLYGRDGDDAINGGDGNDYLRGGEGADALDGGADNDIASYSSSNAGVNIDLLNSIYSGGDADGDTLTNIENITGSRFNDIIVGDAQDNLLSGGDGNDTIDGGDGDDIIYAGYGNDIINGGRGNDIIHTGWGSNDIINGGDGDDMIYNRYGNDIIDGGAGIDTVDAGAIINIGDNIIIQKDLNRIDVVYVGSLDIGISIEFVISDTEIYGVKTTIDVKGIWGELAAAEQAKFTGEAEFLSWLGDDAGYNYEGL